MPARWAVTGQLNDRAFVLQTEWRDIPATRDGAQSAARGSVGFSSRGLGRKRGRDAGTMTLELENAGGDRMRKASISLAVSA
jgi:hypothetical protein